MLHEIFYWLFNMSMMATFVGVIVLLIRKIKKIPRRVSVMLWIAPFLRMCIPIGISSQYSFIELLSKMIPTKTVAIYQMDYILFSSINGILAAEDYFPIIYKKDIMKDVFTISAIIWLIVFGAIILTLSVLYIVTLREMKDAVYDRDNVYYSDKITSPAVYGIIKSKIILPVSYKEKDIRFVLLHEKIHIKRKDNLWRIVGFIITALHWFNPFSWIFLKLFLGDMELACDEHVISNLDESEIKAYAHSLLDSKEHANVFVSAFGGVAIRTRIENILSFKKMTSISCITFLILLIAILGTLLTNAT